MASFDVIIRKSNLVRSEQVIFELYVRTAVKVLAVEVLKRVEFVNLHRPINMR